MFQGTQGNINDSTAASGTEPSFIVNMDMENPKKFDNPLVSMPKGHENYSPTDFERCPVMSGKIKPPVQQEEAEEEEYDSDSSDEEEVDQDQMPPGHEGYSEKDKERCPTLLCQTRLQIHKPQMMMITDKRKRRRFNLAVLSYQLKAKNLLHLFIWNHLLKFPTSQC